MIDRITVFCSSAQELQEWLENLQPFTKGGSPAGTISKVITHKHTMYKLKTIAKVKPATCWSVKLKGTVFCLRAYNSHALSCLRLTVPCRLWKASRWAWSVPPLICLTWAASAPSAAGLWSRRRSASPGHSAACAPHHPSNPLLLWDIKR